MDISAKHIQLDSTVAFAIYRLPGEADKTMIIQTGDASLLQDNHFTRKGFAVQSFHPDEPSYFIEEQTCHINPNWSFEILRSSDSKSTDKKKYLRKINKAINDLNPEMLKVVLSRIKMVSRGDDPIPEVFDKMCDTYSNAFCYVIYAPSFGCWMGATPEPLLISTSKERMSTMALAGTQRYIKNSTPEWSEKEVDEQLIVTQYLRKQLISVGIDYVEYPVQNMRIGPLLHLSTTFEFGKTAPHSLLNVLHPTPAVCGMDKDQAQRYILKNEGYSRRFYTGFLGPTNHLGLAHFYVNLRCMEVYQNTAKLYLGGGITSESNAEMEWAETEWKSEMMMNILR